MITKLEIRLDLNGNKTLRISTTKGTLKVQTNGNLPGVHKNGLTWATFDELQQYYRSYGSDRAKEILEIDGY